MLGHTLMSFGVIDVNKVDLCARIWMFSCYSWSSLICYIFKWFNSCKKKLISVCTNSLRQPWKKLKTLGDMFMSFENFRLGDNLGFEYTNINVGLEWY